MWPVPTWTVSFHQQTYSHTLTWSSPTVPVWDATPYFSKATVKHCFDLEAIDNLPSCRRVYSEPAASSLVAVFHSVSTWSDGTVTNLSLNVLGAAILVSSDWCLIYSHMTVALCSYHHVCYIMPLYDIMHLCYAHPMQTLVWYNCKLWSNLSKK